MKNLILLSLISAFLITGCTAESNSLPESSNPEAIITTEITETELTTKPATTQAPVITVESTEALTEEITEEFTEIIPEAGQLVNILDYIPDAEIDIKYATADNFTGTVIYDDSEAYLCYGTVKKLMAVQDELKEMGYRILIWDAYRPVEAQWKLWETYPNPAFVANPNNGVTSHSRGNTIDISIVYADGSPVEMPSAFDEFTAIADRDYDDVSETAAKNSRLLEDVMYRNGFTGYSGEWWDYSDTEQYEIKPVIYNNSESVDYQLNDILNRNNLTYDDISESSQLIIVESDTSDLYNCNVYFYQKIDDIWSQVRKTTGFIGKNGIATDKVEGDYCTPAGLYKLGFGFGTESVDTQIEYRIINDNCYWVDDSDSEYYNQWVESQNITWKSAEHLADYPESYHYGIVINYNMNPAIPNKGSAIFLHCSTGSYTAGCVAIPEETMSFVLKWLKQGSESYILIY